MDLFDMFGVANLAEPSKTPPVDLVNELDVIIKKHGARLPDAALQELASLYADPPPWAPWK